MNHAEQVKAQFVNKTNKKVTVQSLADQFDHIVVMGLGTKTFSFKDGSMLRIRGRGKHYRLDVVKAQQQAA